MTSCRETAPSCSHEARWAQPFPRPIVGNPCRPSPDLGAFKVHREMPALQPSWASVRTLCQGQCAGETRPTQAPRSCSS